MTESVDKMEKDTTSNQASIALNDENKESITLIWFDPNIGSREDIEQTKQELRRINDCVKFYTDLEQCITYIQSVQQEKIFLVTSGSRASQILPRVASCRQIDCIFIFCMKKQKYQNLMVEFPKIIGIYIDLDDLSLSIKEQIDLVDKQIQTFSFFDRQQKSTKDLSKESGAFLWFQLFSYIIARFPRNEHAKNQMIEICRQYYRGNTKESKLIDRFAREYRSENAIHWYSKQSFVYRLVNKALRTEDMDLLYIFRFFIGDLSHALHQEHRKILSNQEEILTVYRGLKMNYDEFEKLKENQGKLISTNGYLSTSRCRSLARSFALKATKRIDIVPVLFEIKCHVAKLGQSIVYADIAQFSEYPMEEEVLFDLNACFQIESIEEKDGLQIVKMNVSNEGETITKSFLEQTRKETEEQSIVIVFGRLMCNLGDYDKSQKYFEQLLNDPNGEDLAWIEFNLGRALDFKGELQKARDYYDRAYEQMIKAKPARIKDSAYVLNNIGVNLVDQGMYDQALHYHQQALMIREKYYPPGHSDIAISLDNIGRIFRRQEKYEQALDHHQRALDMRKKYYPSGHIDIARSLNNIGKILDDQQKYEEGLDYLQQALQMREQYFPSGHIYIAHSLSDIGTCYENQKRHKIALEYYQRALAMYGKFVPEDSPDRIKTQRKIEKIMFISVLEYQ